MIDGVDVMVGVEHVQNLSLALHELATNAAKYGALSNESGKVEICWTIAGSGNRLKFIWEERGGPRVAAPTRSVVIGHGNALIYLPIFRHLQCSNNYQPHGTLQHGGAVWRWRIESSGEPRLPS
jgi:anti-sigma regulatory factor (Ser/Thr protein kinase)